MTQVLNLTGDFRGKTAAPPSRPEYDRAIECRRCGSSLQGRLERRQVRESRTWPYRVLVETFLCPCRGGTRRRIERPLKGGRMQ
jgi:hypothetical protein